MYHLWEVVIHAVTATVSIMSPPFPVWSALEGKNLCLMSRFYFQMVIVLSLVLLPIQPIKVMSSWPFSHFLLE